MSYGKQPTSNYKNKRPFNPSAWTMGLQGALKKASKLQSDGFTIETERGALSQKQADDLIKSMGPNYDSERIPISEDPENYGCFVGIKRKQASPKTAGAKGLTTRDAFVEALNDMFNVKPAEEDGLTLDQDKVIGLVEANTTSTNYLVSDARNAIASPYSDLDVSAIEFAITNKKPLLTFNGGDDGYDTGNIQLALSVLGDNLKIGKVTPGGTLFLGTAGGDIIFIAPITDCKRDNPDETMTYEDATKKVISP